MKPKILIIEQSDIIRRGLVSLLLEENNVALVIEQCNGECDLQHAFLKALPHVLIASPAIFAKYEKEINVFREKHDFQNVGLIYTYHHPDSLTGFDALIHLSEKFKNIQATINALVKTPALSNSSSTGDALTKREKEVLKLLVSGFTTRKIADTLFISTHTVNTHRKNIMRKLDIKTVSGLTIYAVLNNIISLQEA